MRKRPILLAAAVAVVGLAALGTVVAQQPGGSYPQPAGPGSYLPPPTGSSSGQPKPVVGGNLATTPVTRPYNEWTPNGGSGAVRPAGGVPNNSRLTTPGVAGGNPIQQTGGTAVPPPRMDLTVPPITTPVAPGGTGALPPPSLSVEGADNKFTPAPPITVPPPGPNPSPFVVPDGKGPPPPLPIGVPPAPKPFPVPPPSVEPFGPAVPPPPAPGPAPIVPFPPSAPSVPAAGAMLPNKTNHGVTVEALCPATVTYNTEFEYVLLVKNTGNVAVQNLRVEDELPAGCRYVSSEPAAELNGDKLVWALGALDGNADKRIAVKVRPTEEGEIKSRATVTFSTAVEAKTKVTRPRVAVVVTAPEVSRVGEEATFVIKVSNSGTGEAKKVVLKAYLSDGLFHKNQNPNQPNNELKCELAVLAAGETKEMKLTLTCLKAGQQMCQILVTADGSQDTTAKAAVTAVEPMLQIAQTGPAKCLVRGEVTYEITLSNPGTAATDALTVKSQLPDGFEFVQASDSGTYNTTHRYVTWKLSGLPASGTKAVGLKLRAAAAGDVSLHTEAVATPDQPIAQVGVAAKPAGRVLEAKTDTAIKAEGVAAVRFDVTCLVNPVEVGKDAEYEIRVTNQGTGACTNVQLYAAMEKECTFSGSTGGPDGKGGNVQVKGQTLVFDPIATLPVKGVATYTVKVKSNVAGDQKFRVQMTCDQMTSGVVKEESTKFINTKQP